MARGRLLRSHARECTIQSTVHSSEFTLTVFRRAFVAASVGWAAALPLAPLAARSPYASSVAYVCAAAVYAVGSVVCHQLPARSFHLGAAQWPVCARCTGIYFGAAVVCAARAFPASARRANERATARLAAAPEARRRQGSDRRSAESLARRPKAMLLVSVLPSALTLIYEWTTGEMPSNHLRFVAGIPIGLAVAWVVVAACRDANQVN